MWDTARNVAVAGLLLALPLLAQRNSAQQHVSQPPDAFVTIKGVRLHYFDWGGRGQVLLLLTALGDTGHGFDSFAPRFTDRFHVLVLTRRGQGQSDKPTSGYDTDTLAGDIKGFLDLLRIDRVNLAGHSIAGAEMTRFASRYPERVRKLVYLDAAIDYAALAEMSAEAPLPPLPDAGLAAIQAGANASHPDYAKVTAPALAFFVVYDVVPRSQPQDDPALKRYLQLLYDKRLPEQQIQLFQTAMKRAKVVTLHDANHYDFFQDPKHADDVVREMRTFLSQ